LGVGDGKRACCVNDRHGQPMIWLSGRKSPEMSVLRHEDHDAGAIAKHDTPEGCLPLRCMVRSEQLGVSARPMTEAEGAMVCRPWNNSKSHGAAGHPSCAMSMKKTATVVVKRDTCVLGPAMR